MLESGKLHVVLQKYSLEHKAVIPVTRSLFLYCLEFVFIHRLAPLWNKIDTHFIQGKDFLAEENKMWSIQASLSLTDKITLAMKAQLIKLPKAKVEDFGVSPNILQKFHQSQDFVIHGYSLENNKCLVLPSLKTGYITSISHQDFTGIDFKRYWKVTYGFRLPSAQGGDVFYNVRFPMSGKIFSYPECCIRSKEPHVSLRCDQTAIFKSFLEDLKLRMPDVCGSPFVFTSSTLYSTNSLYCASVAKQTNLTRTPVLSNAKQPFSFTKKAVSSVSDTPNCPSKITMSLPNPNPSTTLPMHGSSSLLSTVRPNCIPLQNTVQTNLDKTDKLNEHPCQSNAAMSDIPRTMLNKHVPQTIVEAPGAKPYVPRFTKRRSDKVLSKTTTKAGRSRKEMPLVPCFKKSDSKNKTRYSKAVKTSANGRVDRDWQRADCSGANDAEMETSCGGLSLSLNNRQVVIADSTMNMSSTDSNDNSFCVASQFPVEQRWPVVAVKRPSESELAKKKKEGAEVIVDVRKMVAENKLSKVSAASITKWLKSEGVKCRCREKKQDLMLKVYQYLDLKQSEQ
ncbi:uncharacterized protein LOC114532724 [Dendronephthya gigantea]|uniref:uncharacterized protein LOC114532724 n=1 Tax=Dendronephthya gigantea TaxID=151771 RepID=UPI00106CB5CD|nr:uncharacterized protein LOC114532724 [Dendronephthya gigantea]XP_028410097.1 uncharacterized protein LOC114532724 [Dendronephthya gigantea]XP_028410098.1 uncharacterized protein LOC114532724 [Dendronephthya gigantea]